MKVVSPALAELLDGNEFVMADLYTLTTATGVIARYTSYDLDLIWDGHVYLADGPVFERGNIRLCLGLEVDSLDVSIHAGESDLLMGAPILQVAHNHGLDGSRMRLDRAFMADHGGVVVGVISLFPAGRLVVDSVNRQTIKISVRPDTELLNRPMPRNIYTPGCMHQVFDAGCSLSRLSWQSVLSVVSGDTRFLTTADAHPDGFFTGGDLLFMSGVNAGVSRSIRGFSGGVIELSLPLVTAPAPGDTLHAWPGCDGLKTTCLNRFANLPNFRGYPSIPKPETAT